MNAKLRTLAPCQHIKVNLSRRARQTKKKRERDRERDRQIDRPTDRQTDQPTDQQGIDLLSGTGKPAFAWNGGSSASLGIITAFAFSSFRVHIPVHIRGHQIGGLANSSILVTWQHTRAQHQGAKLQSTISRVWHSLCNQSSLGKFCDSFARSLSHSVLILPFAADTFLRSFALSSTKLQKPVAAWLGMQIGFESCSQE